jgi:DnaJ like chaperone protein
VIYRFPNAGCLLLLVAIAMAGGTPLFVGLARLALFFFLGTMLLGTFAAWRLRSRAVESQQRFEETLVYLLVRLAQADGSLDRREVTVIREFFQTRLGYTPEKLLRIRDLIKEARESDVTVEELCTRMNREFTLQTRLLVVDLLGRVARADGQVGREETALLEDIARRLQLGPFHGSFDWFQWQQGFGSGPGGGPARSGGQSVDEALAVLGLAAGATPAEIKQAWRKLSKEHHPDRVTHLGEEVRRVAEERMRRINAAYDTLKSAGLAS